MTRSLTPRLAPSNPYTQSLWFNLRRVQDFSPTGTLADPATEKRGLSEFLRGHGVEAVPDHLADPLARCREYLARPDGDGPSRFCDGSFRVVYLGDSGASCLAEVTHHLARSLAESGAEKARTHYFVLAQFELTGLKARIPVTATACQGTPLRGNQGVLESYFSAFKAAS